MSKPLIIAIAALALLGAAVFALYKSPSPPEPVFCTEDAKLCPDGSYVGRTGPKCEFAKCPGGDITQYQSGIRGKVLLGPTCPVERIPPDPACSPKLYQTKLVATTADQSRVIKEFSSDASGLFAVSLPPGEYAIRSAAAANVWPYCASNDTIKVAANAYADITIQCDTGIR